MAIKLNCISATYGFNAVRNVLGKNSNNPNYVMPVFLGSNHLPVDDITGEPIEADCVWDSMRIVQASSRHKIKDPFFRVTICPTFKECNGWSIENWKQCLDDAVRHLDNTVLLGYHTELSNCQWAAAVHLKTENPCIHLIANRITMDDRCQNSFRIGVRAVMAANAMAEERGWTKAKDIHTNRCKKE